VEESPEWTTIVNWAEKKRINFCKILVGKAVFRPLTLKEVKVVRA
jgi:hypothetical protein